MIGSWSIGAIASGAGELQPSALWGRLATDTRNLWQLTNLSEQESMRHLEFYLQIGAQRQKVTITSANLMRIDPGKREN